MVVEGEDESERSNKKRIKCSHLWIFNTERLTRKKKKFLDVNQENLCTNTIRRDQQEKSQQDELFHRLQAANDGTQ